MCMCLCLSVCVSVSVSAIVYEHRGQEKAPDTSELSYDICRSPRWFLDTGIWTVLLKIVQQACLTKDPSLQPQKHLKCQNAWTSYPVSIVIMCHIGTYDTLYASCTWHPDCIAVLLTPVSPQRWETCPALRHHHSSGTVNGTVSTLWRSSGTPLSVQFFVEMLFHDAAWYIWLV